ncbi:hypothetical protein KU6B_15730 [Mameliella alba]|nr:hypothetical protein KU6B_15730 [Mameliella alba]
MANDNGRHDRNSGDHRGPGVRLWDRAKKFGCKIGHAGSLGEIDSQDMFGLAEGDQDGSPCHETGHDRMRDELDGLTEARQPHYQLQNTDHEGQRDGRRHELRAAGLPGSKLPESAPKTKTEIAVAGPETACQLEPTSAAITVGTIAV